MKSSTILRSVQRRADLPQEDDRMVVVAEDFPTERVTEAKTALEEDRMFIQEKGRLVEASDMRPNLTSDLDKSLKGPGRAEVRLLQPQGVRSCFSWLRRSHLRVLPTETMSRYSR